MKKTVITSLAAAVVALLVTGSAFAVGMSTGSTPSARDDAKLNAPIMMLNYDAKLPQADTVIMKQLADNFSVKSDKITSLMHKNLQYGEVAAILAFADKLPGGVTDANINKVMTLHQSKPGWGQVADSLNVNPSDIAAKLSTIEDYAHTGIKQALIESSAMGVGAGGLGGMVEPGEATGGTGTYEGGTETQNVSPEESDTGISGSGTGGVDSGTTGTGTGGVEGNSSEWSGAPAGPNTGGY